MYMHMSMSMCVCGVWSVECARQGAYSSHSDVGDVWDMKWCVGGVRTRHATAGRLQQPLTTWEMVCARATRPLGACVARAACSAAHAASLPKQPSVAARASRRLICRRRSLRCLSSHLRRRAPRAV